MSKNIAIITGASSGMGQQMVYLLDKMAFNEIWGIAIDLEGLKETEKNIQTKFRKFDCDLTKSENIQNLKLVLEKEKPNVLFLANCSGFCKFGDYSEIPLDISVNMIELNVVALVKMTEMILPFMPNGARIIQIASMAGLQSTPYMNVYGATKAFVLSYSRGLHTELKPRGISCTCMCPLWTNTKFQNVARKTSKTAVNHISSGYNPKDVVKKGLKDAVNRKQVSIYGAKSFWQRLFVKLMPHSLIMNIWSKQQLRARKIKINEEEK